MKIAKAQVQDVGGHAAEDPKEIQTSSWGISNHPGSNINHKGLQRPANEYAKERRIYKDLISKKNNVDILNSASRILQC